MVELPVSCFPEAAAAGYPSFMPKRGLMLGILAVGVLATLIVFFTRPREPSYNGRCLSAWITMLGETDLHNDYRQDAVRAVRQIGSQAVPYLLRWIQVEPPSWVDRTRRQVRGRLGGYLPSWVLRENYDKLTKCIGSARAFKILGEEAAGAIPDLVRIVNEPLPQKFDETITPTRRAAAVALAAIGQDGARPLVEAITNQPLDVQYEALLAVSYLGSTGRLAVPGLVKTLLSDDVNTGTRHFARTALRRIAPEALTNDPLPAAP
jgi:HEAT repeat protein